MPSPWGLYSIPRIACVGSFSLHEVWFGLTTCKEYLLLFRRYNTFMECFFSFLFCLGFVGVACRNNCLTAHFVTRTWTLLWQDMTHNSSKQNITPKGLGWVGLSWVGWGWVELSWVGLGWVELSWVGLGWVGLGWSMGVSYYNMNIVVVLSRVKYLHHSHVWMMMMMMICMLWVLLCFTSSTSNF